MKVSLKLSDQVQVESDADTMTEVFEELSSLQEVFGDLTFTSKDGKFTTSNVRLVVRKDSDDNKYYEAVVMERGPYMYAKKKFGCHKKGGGLFPKKEESHKSYWTKFNKEKNVEEEV